MSLWPDSFRSATIREESRPPDNKTPIGTSEASILLVTALERSSCVLVI